jgi:uncharacterized membrane protein YedE/YeeE
MMTEFEPISAIVGGLLIGLAASVLLLANGRIAGISGILGRTLALESGELSWRILFLLGLPVGAGLVGIIQGGLVADVRASIPRLVVAGVLVGFGTQLGNGCTSGHGVCGISRGSRRSIAATCTFMITAAAVVFIVRHVLGGSA